MTSNRPPDDWYATFPDPVVGGAILDRLVSSAIKILTTAGRCPTGGRSWEPSHTAHPAAEPPK
ncbi:MAG: hypothetical protein OXJ90_23440 [Spirochaetaceae bacterium]|nr:hypothetical protein [Spirochaetaceae bacterium]